MGARGADLPTLNEPGRGAVALGGGELTLRCGGVGHATRDEPPQAIPVGQNHGPTVANSKTAAGTRAVFLIIPAILSFLWGKDIGSSSGTQRFIAAAWAACMAVMLPNRR